MDNKRTIIIIIVISIIILSIVGTYAFFTSKVTSDENTLNASSAKFDISLNVISEYYYTKLIPMDDNLAVTGYNNGCKDINDFQVCQAYKIILENSAGTGQNESLSGTINFNLNHVKNLSYMVLDENGNNYIGPVSITSNSDLSLGNSVVLADGESRILHLIIWLSNISYRDQSSDDANGGFSASVTYRSVSGNDLSSMITGTLN